MLETLQHLFHKQHKFSVYNKYDKKKSHLLCTFIDYKIELMDEKKNEIEFSRWHHITTKHTTYNVYKTLIDHSNDYHRRFSLKERLCFIYYALIHRNVHCLRNQKSQINQ